MLEIYYNLWNLLSMWLFLLTNMMTSNSNNNSNNTFTTNLNTHVNFIDNNSHNYLSFNMCLVSNYINTQLIYYYVSDTIFAADQACFQQLMKQCKTSLELLKWDNTFNENNKSDISEDSIISANINSNFNCSALLSEHKSIKINVLNILKLMYNSTVTQYNN